MVGHEQLTAIHAGRPVRHPLAEELFGNLNRHQFNGLRQSLTDHPQGARVWLYQGQVLCGWHTYLACTELNLKPEFVEIEAKDSDEAIVKALSLELHRRSMTDQQRCAVWSQAAERIPVLRRQIEQITREADERKRARLKRGSESISRQPQPEANGKAAHQIANIVGVSRAVFERDQKLFHLSPQWHRKVAAGEVNYETAIRNATGEAHVERARSLPRIKRDDMGLHHCDFRELNQRAGIDAGSVRLVFLDPPYYKTSIAEYGDAAEMAARWLDPQHGFLVAFVGGLQVPKILELMLRHLHYHWVASIFYGQKSGTRTGQGGRRVRECHRPVLIFRAKEETTSLRVFTDALESREAEKCWHWMQQPLNAMKHYVQAFTDPHDLVVETHGGGFTGAVACLLTNRRYIGCDIDPLAVEKGELRLREAEASSTEG